MIPPISILELFLLSMALPVMGTTNLGGSFGGNYRALNDLVGVFSP